MTSSHLSVRDRVDDAVGGGGINASSFQYLPGSAFIFIIISFIVYSLFPSAQDAAIIPITLCGIFIGAELIRVLWLRLDILSPRAVIAIFGVYFFYAVPIIHISSDHWLSYIPPPDDWHRALGSFAQFQAVCILLYLFFVSLRAPHFRLRELNEGTFRKMTRIVIVLGIASWVLVAMSFGGPVAYLRSLIEETAELSGYGTILILAECWPSLLLAVILVMKREKLRTKPGLLILIFIGFLLLQFVVGGLRGSRAVTVWPFFIGLLVCHLVVRRISFRILVLVALALFGFSWIYSIYKSAAGDIVNLFTGEQSATELADDTGRSLEMLVTEDFGRAGVQSLAFYHLRSGWEPMWGETYLGDIQKFVPDALHSFEWRDKTAAATEMFYGLPTEDLGGFKSSRILGLTGEAMVNFGFVGPLLVFAIFGFLIARADQFFHDVKLHPEATGSAVIASVLPAVSILALISDLDNLILFSLKYALPLVVVAWLSSRLPVSSRSLRGI